jgi:hypothetical protein
MREKPVKIEVRKSGQHWAVLAEEQLIALTVYEKGAQMLEATLRGLLRYTSRKLFRLAVSDAMKGPKPAEPAKGGAKPTKAAKAKATPVKAKAKKPVAKKERVIEAAPGATPEPPVVPTTATTPEQTK